MIRDARLSRGDERLEADVCVVGAGPAGITLTHALIRSGLKVVLLEAGPIDPDLENQRMAEGDTVGLPYTLQEARARAFGGTAHFWNIDMGGGSPGLRLRRLDESDFRPREWIPHSGWPFELEEFVPYYERAEASFGIDGQTYALPDDYTNLGPLIDGDSEFESTVFRLGRASSILEQRKSMADSDSVDVVIGAVGVHLERDRKDDISRIRAMSLTGNDFSIEASFYVLAAGAVENARLLLLNGLDSQQSENGEQGLVGRFFMEHPHTRAGFIIPASDSPSPLAGGIRDIGGAPGELWFRLADDAAASYRVGNIVFALTPVTASEMRRAIGSAPQTPAVRAARDIVSHFSGKSSKEIDIAQSVKTVFRSPADIVGAAFRKGSWAVKERRRRGPTDNGVVYRVDVMAEQFPNRESKVSISDSLDPIGLRRVKVNWNIARTDKNSWIRAYDIFSKQVNRSGFGEFVSNPDPNRVPISGGYHHMGTTRMHHDETKGVVDPNGRVHGTSNLYACGSSVFPTSGVSNPTLTIVALSFRLGDHLAARL